MKEYEFVRVELSTMRRRPKEDYQQIIHDYAKSRLDIRSDFRS